MVRRLLGEGGRGMKIPKEMQHEEDFSWVTFKDTSRKGLALSKDVGGLTFVATWVRTDSFIEEPKHELG